MSPGGVKGRGPGSPSLSVMGDPPRELAPERERRLRVALNAADSLTHDAALRLARRPHDWLTGRDPKTARRAAGSRRALLAARQVARGAAAVYQTEARRAREAGADILTPADDEYPGQLAELELPPAVLYRRGRLPAGPAVAIVGSRAADPYGLEVAEHLSADLAAAGLVVVSGFAIGIDGAAHRGALAGGGPTIAVLGCGVDVVYPRAHRKLRELVAGHGALISEFRMGAHPEAHHFPVRNRIIAALAVGTLVVRAEPRSGSLITARQSLDLGRAVWAVPGNITDRRSAGTNSLIRDGAHPVQEARDVLESLPMAVRERLVALSEVEDPVHEADRPPVERQILACLREGEPVGQDTLIAASGLPAEEVVATLLNLELTGLVRRYPGPAYCRRRGRRC